MQHLKSSAFAREIRISSFEQVSYTEKGPRQFSSDLDAVEEMVFWPATGSRDLSMIAEPGTLFDAADISEQVRKLKIAGLERELLPRNLPRPEPDMAARCLRELRPDWLSRTRAALEKFEGLEVRLAERISARDAMEAAYLRLRAGGAVNVKFMPDEISVESEVLPVGTVLYRALSGSYPQDYRVEDVRINHLVLVRTGDQYRPRYTVSPIRHHKGPMMGYMEDERFEPYDIWPQGPGDLSGHCRTKTEARRKIVTSLDERIATLTDLRNAQLEAIDAGR